MNTKIIKLDLNRILYDKIIAKQGDTKSRFLLFQLLDGSIAFNLTNRSVRAYMVKPDGKEIFNDLIINNYSLGYCTLELTNQVLAVPGTVKIELMVTEEDRKLTSSVFELEVIKSINSEKSIVSTNEFTALLNGLSSLSEYDNYKNEIAAARDGEVNLLTKVKKIDEQLDTNANYFENKKMDKNGIISMANMGQDVKEAMTGGSVAIVDTNTILRENIVDNEITLKKLNDNVKSNFKIDYKNVNVNFTEGGFWDYTNGNQLDNVGKISYSEEISVRAGDDFMVSGCSSYRANLYIIKDSNGSVIEKFPNTNEATQIYEDIKFTIPINGVKLCLNSVTDSPTKISKLSDINVNGDKIMFKPNTIEKDILESKLSSLFTDVYNEISLEWVDGSYYRLKNLEIREDNNSSRVKIDVSEGDKYEISGTSYWEANLYYITDKNDEIISTFPNTNQTSTQYKNIRFTIPENGKYLYINQRNNNLLTTLKTVTEYEVARKSMNKKWVAFGDSLTDLNTLGDEPNYTIIVANKLGLELVNCGKGGTGYINNNGGSQQFYNRTSQIPTDTDILTVFGSFNDLYLDNIPIGSITDTEPTSLYGAINKFLSNCWNINPSMTIGIISPTPWRNWWRGHSDTSRANKCVEYVQVLKTVAEYYSLPFLDLFSCSNLRPWEQRIKDLYYLNADGVHPNSLGHEKYIVPKVESFIKSIIQ